MSNFKPYKVEKREGYYIVVDSRTFNAPASYPTTKRNAEAEAATLNTAFAEAVAETEWPQ
jgi:hypothetical protein